jgi:antitoxin PrlF
MSIATITSKGQLTLPKEVRDHLHVDAGDKVEFVIGEGGEVRVNRLKGSAMRLYGMFHRPGMKPLTVEEMDEEMGRHLAEDDERIRGYSPTSRKASGEHRKG